MSSPVTIKDVKVIVTQPAGSRLVIVKVITSEPGLYGLGCATFTQRFHAVVAAIEKHLKPFVLGRDVSRIEELWQMSMVHGYWRNGPVLNNAISGIDQALWDIKGKMAGMPVYDLLGGKCREAAAVYTHADGSTPEEVAENVQRFMEEGYRYVRVQMGGYGGRSATIHRPEGAPDGAYYNPREYTRRMLEMIAYVRKTVGDEVELLHDVHERLQPIDAVRFAKDLEPFNLFFLEDALAPEDIDWFRDIRQQCATRLAMGELFNSPHEWKKVIEEHLVDYIRMHVSQMGGITPARAVALFANIYGVTQRICTWMSGHPTLAFRSGAASTTWSMRCSPAYPKCVTAICIPMINLAWGSISMKNWLPSTRHGIPSNSGHRPGGLTEVQLDLEC